MADSDVDIVLDGAMQSAGARSCLWSKVEQMKMKNWN
jgi:hypothetical protein